VGKLEFHVPLSSKHNQSEALLEPKSAEPTYQRELILLALFRATRSIAAGIMAENIGLYFKLFGGSAGDLEDG